LPILVEPSDEQLGSDAGLLPLRQFDERIGLTQQFAAALDDPRQPQRVRHEPLEMTRSRCYGIFADYEDQNAHYTLRRDPVFKLIAGRSLADPPPPEPNAAVPTEALTGAARRRYQRLRRQRDPLGEGQPCTWWTLLIKVAASVVVSTRRIRVRLAANWPHLDYFRQVSAHVQARPAVAARWSG
jgi:hypothetical protein